MLPRSKSLSQLKLLELKSKIKIFSLLSDLSILISKHCFSLYEESWELSKGVPERCKVKTLSETIASLGNKAIHNRTSFYEEMFTLPYGSKYKLYAVLFLEREAY